MVSVTYLVNMYANGKWPHLLLVDAEGLDYQIIETADFWVPINAPMVICVETRMKDTLKMVQLLAKKGFSSYCRMGENLFFVRKDLYNGAFGFGS